MLARGIIVWGGLLVLAVLNGALRELLFVPRMGNALAHAISSLTLSAAVLMLAWLAIGWIRPASPADAWMVGVVWLVLTLAFEFLAGHYVFGTPWSTLRADYNVFEGRLWILVLVTTALAPVLAARGHGLP